ncbi:MAG: UDP-N-acetylmuramate--L-alanine ligase [Vicingaceae bacterium]|nr:UDP-N-acetylmuramate--L-alanine ligase [Vicingaceae bacterium]
MEIDKLNTVYFLGVGGIGMSALARYFLAQGCKVYGYDKTKTELTEQLEQEGIQIHYEEDVEFLKTIVSSIDDVLICFTPAIPKDNKELQFLQNNDFELLKRSQVLGLISQNYFTIAIAGTHGKTTTSSIVAHVINECLGNCIAFLGGISLNFNSNLLLSKDAQYLVVEADEYDRSFLTLSPDIALITSLDADHLDIYGDGNEMQEAYRAFANKIKSGGSLITKNQYLNDFKSVEGIDISTYGLKEKSATYASDLRIENGAFYADIESGSATTLNVEIGLPGIHNVENAIGAFAIAEQLGIDKSQIKDALASYKGVKRRFEYHIKTTDLVYIDDYAHHPSELEVCIKSVKELYPNKKVTGIFQPHLYSRTRDFLDGFASSLALLDELLLMDIYPARELPIEGVTSQMLLDKIDISEKSLVTKEDLLAVILEKQTEVLLTLGAGDIDVFVKPIAKILGGTNE